MASWDHDDLKETKSMAISGMRPALDFVSGVAPSHDPAVQSMLQSGILQQRYDPNLASTQIMAGRVLQDVVREQVHKILGITMGDPQWGLRMVMMRMRLKEGERLPFQMFHLGQKTTGEYVVIVMQNDDVSVFVDGPELFPSDTLIGQLIMLAKAGEK